MNFTWLKLLLLAILAIRCSSPQIKEPDVPLTFPESILENQPYPPLNKEILYDKVLGMLLGSAIGDAMGAPTEMWSRNDIYIQYGFVDDLDTMVREPSAEGTWDYNLPAGGTTDDTRWKVLMGEFLTRQPAGRLSDEAFARFIVSQYESMITRLKSTQGFDPEPYQAHVREMAWLQEWGLVARPFSEGDLKQYAIALNRFYGGEMTCAGMLYSPVIGAFFPSSPELAYQEAFKLAIFDIGYARDISALTSAMVSAAMTEKATANSVFQVLRDIDPQNYFRSRLVGRSSYRIYQIAREIVHQANSVVLDDFNWDKKELPSSPITDSLFLARTQTAYVLLDNKLQDLPFHPAEIHLVNLTALLFCQMDFRKSLAFIINFGRDNDTTGAVAGAILGAFWGASKLPAEMVDQVMTTNLSVGIDLELLAGQLTEKIFNNYPPG